MTESHGWMWLQGAEVGVDRTEWPGWMEIARRRQSGQPWFKGQAFNRYPTKAQVRDGGPELVLEGWTPPEPIIRPTSRVLAFGSCFAAHFVEWLATNGFNQAYTDSARALMRNPFENVAVIAQQFRWAFGELDPRNLVWIDKGQQRILATEERRLALRQALIEADVFVTTLGLSEVWYDRVTGEPLWRVMPVDGHDPQRHAFKVLSFAETLEAFETIDRIRARWLPDLRIVYTVSPIPMRATFRPISAISANSASKAILRAALDEFLRSRPDALNRTYFYFPGYEFVTTLYANPYKPDNGHLYDHVIDCVLDLFARLYTTREPGVTSPGVGTPAWSSARDEHAEIAYLEKRNEELQKVCDERLVVIDRLKRMCDERLAEIGGRRGPTSRWTTLLGSARATLRRAKRAVAGAARHP
jgi:GSCFA family